MTSSTDAFHAARDLLLDHRRTTHGAARVLLPDLTSSTGADWFDVIAAEHPDRVALRIVADDGTSA